MIVPKRPRQARGIAISRRSIGTVWINGIPYTYNPELIYKTQITTDQIIEDSQPKKRIIIIRRK